MGGEGYGLPVAVVMPSHREKGWYFIRLESNKTHAAQISLLSVTLNLILWPVALALVLLFIRLLNKIRIKIVNKYYVKVLK